jgi:hypothetical protein
VIGTAADLPAEFLQGGRLSEALAQYLDGPLDTNPGNLLLATSHRGGAVGRGKEELRHQLKGFALVPEGGGGTSDKRMPEALDILALRGSEA